MEIFESIAWLALGFLPLLGAMELTWTKTKKNSANHEINCCTDRRTIKFKNGKIFVSSSYYGRAI